jgi:hypothetical protein
MRSLRNRRHQLSIWRRSNNFNFSIFVMSIQSSTVTIPWNQLSIPLESIASGAGSSPPMIGALRSVRAEGNLQTGVSTESKSERIFFTEHLNFVCTIVNWRGMAPVSKSLLDHYESQARLNRVPLATQPTEIPESALALDDSSRASLATTLLKISTDMSAGLKNIGKEVLNKKQALADLVRELREGSNVHVRCMQATRQLLDSLSRQDQSDIATKAAIADMSKIVDKKFDEFNTKSKILLEASCASFREKVERLSPN